MWGTRQVHKSQFKRARSGHAYTISSNLRDSDAREIWAMTPLPIAEALALAIRGSRRAWIWVVNGQVVCIFGVAPLSIISGSGSPWMVATPDIYKHRVAFLRGSRRWVRTMRSMYPLLWNCTAANNAAGIKWLQWLGFNVKEPEPMGRFQEPFCRFEMEGTCAMRG